MKETKQYNYDVFERHNQRWPEASDQMFRPGRRAQFAREVPERNYRLLLGYKYAGDVLIQRIFDGRLDHENLIYPILFCYRHYIELSLKYAVEEHGENTWDQLSERSRSKQALGKFRGSHCMAL